MDFGLIAEYVPFPSYFFRHSLHTAMKTTIAASGAVLEQNWTHAGTSEGDAISILGNLKVDSFLVNNYKTTACLDSKVGGRPMEIIPICFVSQEILKDPSKHPSDLLIHHPNKQFFARSSDQKLDAKQRVKTRCFHPKVPNRTHSRTVVQTEPGLKK